MSDKAMISVVTGDAAKKSPESEEFVIQGNCVISKGSMSLRTMPKLLKMVPKNSVMDSHAARLLGVTLVIGPAEETRALAKAAEPAAITRQKHLTPTLPDDAQRWLAIGERGASSEALFAHLFGPQAGLERSTDHPYDPDDFRRCQLLIEEVADVRSMFERAATLSPTWKRLVAAWLSILAALEREVPHWRPGDTKARTKGSAPDTYALIQSIVRPEGFRA